MGDTIHDFMGQPANCAMNDPKMSESPNWLCEPLLSGPAYNHIPAKLRGWSVGKQGLFGDRLPAPQEPSFLQQPLHACTSLGIRGSVTAQADECFENPAGVFLS